MKKQSIAFVGILSGIILIGWIWNPSAKPTAKFLSSGLTESKPSSALSRKLQGGGMGGDAPGSAKKSVLNYDENYTYDKDGERVTVTGERPLTDIDEIKRYYPDLKIREEYQGFQFYSLAVGKYNSGNDTYVDLNRQGTLSKRDISIKNAGYLELRYRNDRNQLTIIAEDKARRLGEPTIEQLKQTGKYEGYTILKGMPGMPEYYYGFRVDSDDQKYNIEVNISRYRKENEDNGIFQYSPPEKDDKENYNTYEGMLKLIDMLNLKKDNKQLLEDLTFYK